MANDRTTWTSGLRPQTKTLWCVTLHFHTFGVAQLRSVTEWTPALKSALLCVNKREKAILFSLGVNRQNFLRSGMVIVTSQEPAIWYSVNIALNSPIGRIYSRRRIIRPDALNVWRLSASLSAFRFYTRRLKRLRRLIHQLSASIGRT